VTRAGVDDSLLPPTVLAERLNAQLLSGPPAGCVADVTRRLLAIQAQDPRGARLAIRARSAGLHAADVDRALSEERSVLITTLNRGTLHLVRAEDYWWLHPLTTPQLASAVQRRLNAAQITPDQAQRGVRAVERALEQDGPSTRAQLREKLATAGFPIEGTALGDLLLLAGLHGLVVRGPVIGSDHAFVLVHDWLGPAPTPLPEEIALGELARRYLAGHGPAGERDLAKWAGITLGDARRGFAAIAEQLVDRGDGLAAVVDRSERATLPPPMLLGPFDPSLLGWASRVPIVDGHAQVITTNGLIRPVALVGGRVVATWTLQRGTVTITPLGPRISAREANALDADASAVLEFLG
jgi:hypothetical protein